MKPATYLYALAILVFSAAVQSDDTDIFFNVSSSTSTNDNPNVLFIFDTSGSMGEDASQQVPEFYDSDEDYGSSAGGQIYVYHGSLNASDYLGSIPRTNINCDAMLDHIPNDTSERVYGGRVAEWNAGSGDGVWQNITAGSGLDVECIEDSGVHGPDSTSGNVYAASGSVGPYSASSSDEISWSSISNQRYFVSANYHDYLQNPTLVDKEKIDILTNTMSNLVQDFDDMNLGMMRFNNSAGGRVIHHFSDAETDKTTIVNTIEALTDGGWTPLTETLLEAHYYYTGEEPVYGSSSVSASINNTTNNYITPIDGTGSCQSHNVVVISDGAPRLDGGADSTIHTLTGDNSCDHVDNSTDADDQCFDELADYMANTHDYDSVQSGQQGLDIYTIGFDLTLDVLEEAASKGNGAYFEATSAIELRSALTEILQTISFENTTFTGPGVAVNAFNSLQHRDEIYYSVYLPQSDPRWYGNVKKYHLQPNGDILGGNNTNCGTGTDVIDDADGFFLDSAQSCWSSSADGSEVRDGGAADELDNTRTVYTVTDSTYPSGITYPVALNTTANTLSVDNPYTSGTEADNTAVTSTMLGLPGTATAQDRTDLIGWILGQDVNNESSTDINNFFSDPLHNTPVVVTYDINTSGSNPVYDDVLYSASNDGTFRAIDADNGQEIFAFIPPEMLPNQLSYFSNVTGDSKEYGLDGTFTVWVEESDDAGFSINATGEHVYVYIGMRRGGDNYYALDVTDRNNPELLWTIQGGTGDFTDLGQSWSRMKLTKIRENCNTSCTERDVLVFGGGYDSGYDSSASVSDPVGDAIYMVDAETGALIWSAGKEKTGVDHTVDLNMNSSITSDISVVDVNGDGVADALFAVTVLGEVWRIDLDETGGSLNSDHALNTGVSQGEGKITDLASASSDQQYFYNGPNVAISRSQGTPMFVVTIGSGQVPSPLTTSITDRIYVLFEKSGVFAPPADANTDGQPDYITITASNLSNKTGLIAGDTTSGTPADPSNEPGYYINGTSTGEKFLRPSTTFFGITFISSYIPASGASSSCSLADNLGDARLYAIDFVTGESVFTGAYEDLVQAGIPPQPTILYIDDGFGGTTPVLCVGTECFGDDDDENPLPSNVPVEKTYWRENTP